MGVFKYRAKSVLAYLVALMIMDSESHNLALRGHVPAEEGKVLKFSLPSFPPSVNSMYLINHNQRRVSLSDEALLWRTRVTPCILSCDWPVEWLLKLTLEYYSPNW